MYYMRTSEKLTFEPVLSYNLILDDDFWLSLLIQNEYKFPFLLEY